MADLKPWYYWTRSLFNVHFRHTHKWTHFPCPRGKAAHLWPQVPSGCDQGSGRNLGTYSPLPGPCRKMLTCSRRGFPSNLTLQTWGATGNIAAQQESRARYPVSQFLPCAWSSMLQPSSWEELKGFLLFQEAFETFIQNQSVCWLKLRHAQLRPTLCNLTDCSSLPGSSVHEIVPARILEWFAISSSRASSQPGIEPVSPASPILQRDFFTT